MESFPRSLARIAGAMYVSIIILGIIEEVFVRGRIVVPGDAAATAENLKSMESLWRFGIACELLLALSAIAVGVILYVLTRPVSRVLSLLAVYFNLIAIAVGAASTLQLVEALSPLGSAGYLRAFSPAQLDAMAYLAVKAHLTGFAISLLLSSPFFLVTGYLILRARYFPTVLGVLYQIAGVSYLANGFALILAPHFADRAFAIISVPAFIGEASLCLWLLVKGVNVDEWNALPGTQARV